MTFMVIVLVITIILIPIIISLLRWFYRQWCFSASNKRKSEDYIYYIEVAIRFLAFDLLVLICDICFLFELQR